MFRYIIHLSIYKERTENVDLRILTVIYEFAKCPHPNKSVSLYKLANLQRVSFSPLTNAVVSTPGRSLMGVTNPEPKSNSSKKEKKGVAKD